MNETNQAFSYPQHIHVRTLCPPLQNVVGAALALLDNGESLQQLGISSSMMKVFLQSHIKRLQSVPAGYSVLAWASMSGQLQIVNALLDKGVNVNAKSQVFDISLSLAFFFFFLCLFRCLEKNVVASHILRDLHKLQLLAHHTFISLSLSLSLSLSPVFFFSPTLPSAATLRSTVPRRIARLRS